MARAWSIMSSNNRDSGTVRRIDGEVSTKKRIEREKLKEEYWRIDERGNLTKLAQFQSLICVDFQMSTRVQAISGPENGLDGLFVLLAKIKRPARRIGFRFRLVHIRTTNFVATWKFKSFRQPFGQLVTGSYLIHINFGRNAVRDFQDPKKIEIAIKQMNVLKQHRDEVLIALWSSNSPALNLPPTSTERKHWINKNYTHRQNDEQLQRKSSEHWLSNWASAEQRAWVQSVEAEG